MRKGSWQSETRDGREVSSKTEFLVLISLQSWKTENSINQCLICKSNQDTQLADLAQLPKASRFGDSCVGFGSKEPKKMNGRLIFSPQLIMRNIWARWSRQRIWNKRWSIHGFSPVKARKLAIEKKHTPFLQDCLIGALSIAIVLWGFRQREDMFNSFFKWIGFQRIAGELTPIVRHKLFDFWVLEVLNEVK